ncbi:ISL3 family transposase [uncultured Desulfovibrio sp.]|uniref:ISL3 family transposase n=1 Tax=uncultured Desulfovibrio sp. TaxID=167968 RepID=UPI002598647D|nr:ISL3 family transposase [uncultured Desulfovibrio sp.]
MQKKTITKLLNLPNFEVREVLEHHEKSLHLYVDLIDPVRPVCSGCGGVHQAPVHSIGWIRVEDLPLFGKRVFLYLPKRKIRCPKDGKIRVEDFAVLRDRFTNRFAEQVYRLTSITTNTEAAWFLSLDDETVYRIDRGILEELAKKMLSPVPVLTQMSVDEVAWKKWHKYVTNVVDIDRRKVIWNHNGRGKGTLDTFFSDLGEEKASQIGAVACDGARGYLSSIKQHAKNALIVLDHFHVKSYLNDAVDTVRKEELHQARKDKDSALADLLHCRKKFILMQGTPSKRQRNVLEQLAELNDRVYRAMLLKEQFLEIYRAGAHKTARANLREWIGAAMASNIPAFVELGQKFFRKRHLILNFFRTRITAAISEGINNKIKRLKRMAYGYRDVAYFLLKIHQHCGLLNPRFST